MSMAEAVYPTAPTLRQAGGPFSEWDGLSRKQPRRFASPDYLLLLARIEPGRVRRVPASAIVSDASDDEGGELSLIECPCGARPVVRSALRECPGCERWYSHVGPGAVYVAYADAPPPLRREV
jgi:hypothetical protein